MYKQDFEVKMMEIYQSLFNFREESKLSVSQRKVIWELL